jgi:4-azaleucine resistance transporter AzlC
MASRRDEFVAGVRSELPLLVGVLPFGMIYGVLALSAGLPPGVALAMSSIVFAGSAQMISTQLFSAAVPGPIVVLTTFVVNLRHMLYSASVAPHLRPLRPAWKALLAYLLTDEAYAVTITSYNQANPSHPNHRHWFFLGAGLALWTTWQLSTGVGIFLGAQLPASWALDFALPLTFIALVVPPLKDRAGLAAAVTAGMVALAGADLPYKLGLILAAIGGIVAGLWVESRILDRAPSVQPVSVDAEP